VTEVAQRDYVVETKKRCRRFYPTDLDFLLRNMGAKRLVLNGCMTDCCVLNTAFDASNFGYRVTVAKDLVRGTNEDMEDAALKMISLHIGLVVESRHLLEEWRRQVDAASRRCRAHPARSPSRIGVADEDCRSQPSDERAYAGVGRLCRQPDVLTRRTCRRK
jgi:hypothetical protein